MPVPLFIPLARQRAASFRTSVELFRDYYPSGIPQTGWSDLWMIVRPFSRDSMRLVEPEQVDVPLVVENALVWAHPKPGRYYDADELREARELLDGMLADWDAAWVTLARLVKGSSTSLSADHWLHELISLTGSRQRQVSVALSEGWPLPPKSVELKAVQEMNAGTLVGLDEAFARLAGTSKEGWSERVAQHTRKTTE